MDCYHCGQEGHRRSECPERSPLPPAFRPSATADQPTPMPPPPPPRRPESEIADPTPWAQQLRDRMGWSKGKRDERKVEMAREQVIASRRERWLFR